MNEKPVYVVSDIHLGAVPSETERRFRQFLAHVAADASKLLINGDLFDFWFEYRTVIQAQHYRVLSALTEVREAGIEIQFVGGNHDAWGGEFLRQVGLELVPDPIELELAGRRALVVHGDGVGRGDLGYRILKRIIRSPVSVWAFRMLHPDLGGRIARFVSTTDAKLADAAGANLERAAELASWAKAELERRPELELVLAGHTHTPTVTEFFPGRFYVNTGDWIHHYTYLVLRPEAPPELLTWG